MGKYTPACMTVVTQTNKTYFYITSWQQIDHSTTAHIKCILIGSLSFAQPIYVARINVYAIVFLYQIQ